MYNNKESQHFTALVLALKHCHDCMTRRIKADQWDAGRILMLSDGG